MMEIRKEIINVVENELKRFTVFTQWYKDTVNPTLSRIDKDG